MIVNQAKLAWRLFQYQTQCKKGHNSASRLGQERALVQVELGIAVAQTKPNATKGRRADSIGVFQ